MDVRLKHCWQRYTKSNSVILWCDTSRPKVLVQATSINGTCRSVCLFKARFFFLVSCKIYFPSAHDLKLTERPDLYLSQEWLNHIWSICSEEKLLEGISFAYSRTTLRLFSRGTEYGQYYISFMQILLAKVHLNLLSCLCKNCHTKQIRTRSPGPIFNFQLQSTLCA